MVSGLAESGWLLDLLATRKFSRYDYPMAVCAKRLKSLTLPVTPELRKTINPLRSGGQAELISFVAAESRLVPASTAHRSAAPVQAESLAVTGRVIDGGSDMPDKMSSAACSSAATGPSSAALIAVKVCSLTAAPTRIPKPSLRQSRERQGHGFALAHHPSRPNLPQGRSRRSTWGLENQRPEKRHGLAGGPPSATIAAGRSSCSAAAVMMAMTSGSGSGRGARPPDAWLTAARSRACASAGLHAW